jgi:hypothetical protein
MFGSKERKREEAAENRISRNIIDCIAVHCRCCGTMQLIRSRREWNVARIEKVREAYKVFGQRLEGNRTLGEP